jgi:hypothetical protein
VRSKFTKPIPLGPKVVILSFAIPSVAITKARMAPWKSQKLICLEVPAFRKTYRPLAARTSFSLGRWVADFSNGRSKTGTV